MSQGIKNDQTLTTMSTVKPPRIEIIDALRGFALAGICICHIVEQYIGAGSPAIHSDVVVSGLPDQIIEGFIGIFLRGKFIALFSFLFGLSFFIQMDNGAKKGTGFGGRFLWRLLLLLIIGYAHSLFYRGDILTIYALLGIALIPFYKLDTKWVLGISLLLFLGLGRFIVFYLTGADHLFLAIDPVDMESGHVLKYYETIKNGSLLDVFRSNSLEGHLDKLNFQFGIFGRGYFTFAFFLVGLYVGRSGFFSNFRDRRAFIKKVLIYSLVLFVIALIITAASFLSMGENFTLDSWPATVGLAGYDLINVAMTLIYIVLFVMVFRKSNSEKWLLKLAPFGRMALTNYVTQSLIGTLIFYGWGFGFLGSIQSRYTFLLAIGIIVIQIIASKWWLNHFRYGPLEWVWRSLTFWKWFPMRREK